MTIWLPDDSEIDLEVCGPLGEVDEDFQETEEDDE